MVKRIFILTTGEGRTATLCIPTLAKSRKINLTTVIRATGMKKGNRSKRIKNKLRKVMAIGPFASINGVRLRRWYAFDNDSLDAVCKDNGIELLNVPYIGSYETIAAIRDGNFDLGISLGNNYIVSAVHREPTYGMINVHGERLPKYQNAQSVIWPIYYNETMTGISIHEVNDQIDAGNILCCKEIPIEFCSTLRQTVEKTLKASRLILPETLLNVVEQYSNYSLSATKQVRGPNYTTPTLRQFFRMTKNNRKIFKYLNKI